MHDTGTGDRDAFRECYARWHAPLFSLAIQLVGDVGLAEEVLQDTFVKIWRHASAYDERKSRPFTWAVTILRRTCIDHLRKNQRVPPILALTDDRVGTTGWLTQETTHDTIERQEATEQLRAALGKVSLPQRAALELALFSALTQAEIASRLTQPLGTIKTWIRRGLIELGATMKGSES